MRKIHALRRNAYMTARLAVARDIIFGLIDIPPSEPLLDRALGAIAGRLVELDRERDMIERDVRAGVLD